MVKEHLRRTSRNSIKKAKFRKKEGLHFLDNKKTINHLPVEVLAEILDQLPKEQLPNISHTSQSFRYAVGLVARRDWCVQKKTINDTIDRLILLLGDGGIIHNERIRYDICQKIGYARILKIKMNLLDAVMGNYAHNRDTWKVTAPHVIRILLDINKLLTTVLNCPYFIKDIRLRFTNIYTPHMVKFFNNYYTKIEPVLRSIQTDESDHIQLFNLLNSCESANSRIVAFHPSQQNYSFVWLFFEIRGLGGQFAIKDMAEYTDKNKPDVEKLACLKNYLCRIIELENSEFLFYQLESIANLENSIDFSYDGLMSMEPIENLQNAYRTFLYKTYNNIKIEKTKFNYKDMKIYRHEISRQQEIKTCVSNVTCNLKFCCNREKLPEIIQWEDDDINSYQDTNEYILSLSEYLKLQHNIFNGLKRYNNEIYNTAANINICVSHKKSLLSTVVVMNQLQINIAKKRIKVKVITDDTISRFEDIQCECEENGGACNSEAVRFRFELLIDWLHV